MPPSSNTLRPSTVQEACELLESNDPRLKEVRLWKQAVNEQQMTRLVDALNKSTHIETLILTGSLRDDPDLLIPLLENVIPGHPSLQKLNLGGNRLNDKHALLIGEALTTNKMLKELYISHNNIRSCRGLAAGLGSNQTLEVLGLSSNKISDQGCQLLAKTLTNRNCILRELHLCQNKGIGKTGTVALEESLQINCSLEKLVLVLRNKHLQPSTAGYRGPSGNKRYTRSVDEDTQHQMRQQNRIDRSCESNARAKRVYKNLKRDAELLPKNAYPNALSCLNKPDLLFHALKMKPELFKIDQVRQKEENQGSGTRSDVATAASVAAPTKGRSNGGGAALLRAISRLRRRADFVQHG